MVNKIKETFLGHSLTQVIIHQETWPTDQEGQDHHREVQLEERAVLRRDYEFNTCRIIMSREFYRIKQLVRGSKRRRLTRPHCQSMPFKSGAKSSGRRGLVVSKKSGSFLEMLAKKITTQRRP